jgi:hypothetical protein
MSVGFRRFYLRDIRYHFLGNVVRAGYLPMSRGFVHLVQVDQTVSDFLDVHRSLRLPSILGGPHFKNIEPGNAPFRSSRLARFVSFHSHPREEGGWREKVTASLLKAAS